MDRIKRNKKVGVSVLVLILVASVAMGVFFATGLNANYVNALSTDKGRVAMVDLMDRYPVDWVIGPLAAKNADGVYVDADGNPAMDRYGNPTNNTHGIPRNQYFNVDNYIYTEPNADLDGAGKTLYGWKPDIIPISPRNAVINENGYVIEGETATTKVGIYVEFDGITGTALFGTSQRYALIVPDDVTQIGQSNGGYSLNGTAYYVDREENSYTYFNTSTSADDVKFTDFGNFIARSEVNAVISRANYFQPRERLVGVYFTQNSKLKSIDGGTEASDNAMYSTNRSNMGYRGKSAFARCDNMRFFIMPNGVESIGRSAFYNCAQLVDVNIPSTVNSLGNRVFYNCSSLLHITVPSGLPHSTEVFFGCKKLKDIENLSTNYSEADFSSAQLFNYTTTADKSALYVVGGVPTTDNDGNKVYDSGKNGYLFCQNVIGDNSVFATISGHDQRYVTNGWYAMGFSGDTDSTGNKTYILPNELSDNSDRRVGIKYDYIDSSGNKRLNSFGEGAVTQYDIAKDFANGTWCINIVMPKSVRVIGDSAFSGSHTRYMETYATYIGQKAFYGCADVGLNQNGKQWYYLHNPSLADYHIGSDAFTNLGAGVTKPDGERFYIFENKALYDKVTTNGELPSYLKIPDAVAKYQIPVYVNVYSEDGEQFTVTPSDMSVAFFNDSDYDSYNPTIKQGDNKVLITKRLNGYAFTDIKRSNGWWGKGESVTYPALSNMESTVWYSDADCTTKITSADGIGSLYNSSTSVEVNVYTRKIKYPDYNIAEWSFDEAMEDAQNADTYSFNKLLGLADDYVVDFVRHVNSWLDQSASVHAYVKSAGTYTLKVSLNAEKWGVWKNPDADKTQVEATVKQKEIDLGKLENIPTFYIVNTRTGNTEKLQRDEKTPIYEHIDGTYSTVEANSIGFVNVINSYTGYAGANLALAVKTADGQDWTMYNIAGDPSSQTSGTDSNRYAASYTFTVKNANYKFVYLSVEANKSDFTDRRMGLAESSMLERSAVLSKQWYITKSSNWLINKDNPEADALKNQYKPVVKTDGSGEAIYNWQYEFDGYKVNIPALANGGDLALTATLLLNGKELVTDLDVANLSFYLNSAMPAGEYELLIHAPEYEGDGQLYPAFDVSYKLTVTPKEFDSEAVQAIIDALTGSDATAGNTFEQAYDGNLFLHNDTDEVNITTLLANLNALLNVKLEGADIETNFWATEQGLKYFGKAELMYNRDELQSSTYYTFDNFDRLANVPKQVGKYLVYYSVYARNYTVVGGEADANRRDYRFTTVIYRELYADDILTEINKTTYTYNGNAVYANVPDSEYYKAFFNADDYINAGKTSVTLTIRDNVLNRWKATSTEGIAIDGADATVTYTVNPAENYWTLTPTVPGWQYGGFDATAYTVMGTLAYPGVDGADGHTHVIYYRIGKLNGNTIEWIDVRETEIHGSKAYFQVNSNGEIIDDEAKTIKAKFDALDVDAVYVLGSFVEACPNGNVNELQTERNSTIRLITASNSWVDTPGMTSWQYQGFTVSGNFAQGTARFKGDDQQFIYKVTDRDGKNVIIADFTDIADVANNLKALQVGTYKLYVTLPKAANNNYNELTYDTTFVVSSADNGWKTTPGLTGWKYQTFTADNFRAGVPNLGSAKNIVYTLTASDGKQFTVNGKIVDSFTLELNADGTALTQDTINALNTLAVRNYTLTASLAGELVDGSTTEYNYKPLTQPITFGVSSVSNAWTESPALTSWKYNEFTISNFIVGIPKYSTPDQVVYALTSAADGSKTVLTVEKVGDNWVLTQTSADALKSLPVGNYTLTAVLAGNADYDELSYSAPVSVTKADNGWSTTPGMTSWQYKGFTSSSNFTAGIPNVTVKADGANANITYTVSGNGITDIVFTSIADVENSLKGLPVANGYTLTVSYPGDNNYNALPYTTYFNVIKAANTWTVAPNLTSWVYKQFNADNFRAGVPAFDEDTTQKVVYALKAKDGLEFTVNGISVNSLPLELNADGTLTAATIIALNSLAVLNTRGGYIVEVNLSGTSNYTDLPETLTFNVLASTNNAWKTNGIPEIDGWIYGDFNASALKAGEAEYGDVIYTIKTVLENGNVGDSVSGYVNLSFADLLAKLGSDGIDAGNYNLYVTTVASNNYNAAEHNVRFTVGKAESNWTVYPAISGWTFGQNALTYTQGATDNAGAITYVFYPATLNDSGVYVVADGAQPVTIEPNSTTTPAGWYALVATAAATTNYQGAKYTVIFEISKADNNWANGCQPEGTFTWVWGKSGEKVTTDTGFVNAKATYCDVNETVKYVIKYPDGTYTAPIVKTKDSGTTALFEAIAQLGVGQYEITVSVEQTGNYSGIERTTYVTVTPASFNWNQAPEDAKWTWDENNDTLHQAFKQPTIVSVVDSNVTIKYSLAGARQGNIGEYTDFATLQNKLKGIDADTYTVTVTVSCTNYQDKVGSAQIIVEQADNDWKTNTPATTLSKEFDDDDFAIQLATADFGTVKYYYNGTEIPDINAWIKTLNKASDTTYDFVTKVEQNYNYKGLEVTTKLTVTGKSSKWDNTWNPTVTQKYSVNMSTLWSGLVLPEHDLSNDVANGLTSSSVKYAINFVSADGQFEVNKTDLLTTAQVREFLGKDANFTNDGVVYRAGTYTVTAIYNPNDVNYTTLTAVVKVVIDKDSSVWTQQLGSEYKGSYQAIEIDTPSANYDVTLSITDSENNKYVWDKNKYTTLQDFIRTLDMGEYTIVSQVEPTNNYDGLSAITTRVTINPALNAWADESVLKPLYTFTRLDNALYTGDGLIAEQNKYFIDIPVASRGEVVCTIDGLTYSAIKNGKLIDLYNLTAGDHTLSFTVSADAKGNYNGLRYDCTIRVSKENNDWIENKEPNPSYTWQGNVKVDEFKVPQAVYHNELLRYEIAKVGDSAFTTLKGLNQAQFEAELAKLVNGTYIVTMHIGGNVDDVYIKDDSATREKATQYNSNYNEFTATTEITVSRYTNSFTTPFEASSWTYGDKVGASAGEGIIKVLTRPVAEHGNEAIVFAVYDAKNKLVFTSKASDYSGQADRAFAELIAWLNGTDKPNAGVYTVTATIQASDVYEAPQITTALYTIGKVTPQWTKTDAELQEFQNVSWIWGDTANNKQLPVLQLANWTANVVYKVNNQILSDDPATADVNEGHWMYYLKQQPSGTYRIVATVESGLNNEELTFEGTVTISLQPNGWNQKLSDGNKALEWEHGKATSITYEPKFNNTSNKITVKINNKVVPIKLNDGLVIEGAETFQQYFNNKCGVGTYTVTITVEADLQYGGLEDSFTVTITKSKDNGWVDNKNFELDGWTWDDITQNTEGWTLNLQIPTPKYGTYVTITVIKNGIEQFVSVLTYEKVGDSTTVNQNDLNAFKSKLWALDAGNYSVRAEIPETNDYAPYVQTTNVSFTVAQAVNVWNPDGKPHISGWDYSGSTAYPDSDPKYGNKNDVVYSYAPAQFDERGQIIEMNDALAGTVTWNTQLPFEAGSYYIRGTLAASDVGNYGSLVGYGSFSINTGANDWVDLPSVIAWKWNGYDAEVNRFSASARNGGAVTFTIKGVGDRTLTQNDFLTKDGTQSLYESYAQLLQNSFGFQLDGDGKPTKIISSVVWDALNALKPNTYVLHAVAAATTNYDEKTGNFAFEVGKAVNVWITAPNVLSFDYSGFVQSGERASFTQGSSKYGTVSYLVVDGNNKVVVVDGITTSATTELTAEQVAALLPKLNAGNYALQAWVTADSDAAYESLAEANHYTVMFSVSRIENGWVTTPEKSIEAYYTDLRATGSDGKYTFDFAAWFAEQQTQHNDDVSYLLLNTDYSASTSSGTYSYDELFDAILRLKAGNYIIRMTVAQSHNYLTLSADTGLTVKRYANEFTSFPNGNLKGQWQLDSDGNNATVLEAFTVTSSKGNGTITYTVNGKTCKTYADFEKEVSTLNANSYQVTIAVEQTDDYEGLSRIVQLDIKQGTNELYWTISPSWTWNDKDNHFDGSSPKYGTQVYVEITRKGSSVAISYITVDFTVSQPTAIVNQVLSGLDAGEYTVKVTAGATPNCAEISQSKNVTVNKAPNAWTEDGAPKLNGTYDSQNNVYVYLYGATVIPSATAQHGTPKYTYYLKDSNTPLKDVPSQAGEYTVEITVEKSDNYEPIKAVTLALRIDKVTNDGFIVSPGAIGWVWGDYDRKVHLFTGIPRTGGNVSFSILDIDGQTVEIDGVKLDKMSLVDGAGIHHNDVNKDLYVSTQYASLISKLVEGNYQLQINVESTTNYKGFTATTPFAVTAATNSWTVTPKIASWSLGLWTEKDNTPKAESRFGHPQITVTSQNNNEVYYKSTFNAETGKYEVLNRLQSALAGWYTMTVTVAEQKGCYNGLNETVDVQVYMRGSVDEKNYWYELPGINSWEARVNGIVNEPYGTPLRGLPYFEFYFAKRNAENQLVIDWTKPVTAGEDSYLVQKGDNKYYKDFYVPMAPGDYFMVACAKNVDSEGNVIEADNLYQSEQPYQFRIEYRTNTFDDDPHIDTLLFLGERLNWAQPTATASLKDSVIWFTYQNAETGEDLGASMPNAEGKYTVIAHALAKYSREITKTANFTVELSTNEWIEQPTIESWSEEFADNDPNALSKYGADQVVFTYENLDTGAILTEKPTTEGNYKMTATVKLEGYRDLVGTATFTIEPAFDTDLVIINIALGCIACALAIFVIIFAIRRYKEN